MSSPNLTPRSTLVFASVVAFTVGLPGCSPTVRITMMAPTNFEPTKHNFTAATNGRFALEVWTDGSAIRHGSNFPLFLRITELTEGPPQPIRPTVSWTIVRARDRQTVVRKEMTPSLRLVSRQQLQGYSDYPKSPPRRVNLAGGGSWEGVIAGLLDSVNDVPESQLLGEGDYLLNLTATLADGSVLTIRDINFSIYLTFQD